MDEKQKQRDLKLTKLEQAGEIYKFALGIKRERLKEKYPELSENGIQKKLLAYINSQSKD